MKKLVIILSILVIWALYASQSNASEPAYFLSKDKTWQPITKVQALKTLLSDQPAGVVFKCNEQEVSDKATLRNKKIK